MPTVGGRISEQGYCSLPYSPRVPVVTFQFNFNVEKSIEICDVNLNWLNNISLHLFTRMQVQTLQYIIFLV